MKKSLALLVLLAGIVLAVWAGSALAEASLDDGATETQTVAVAAADSPRAQAGRRLADELSLAFQSAAEEISPSVVPIFAEKTVNPARRFGGRGLPFNDDFLERFFGDMGRNPSRPVRGVGSGVIVSEDGYVLTNNHVVGDADRLWVVLEDERVDAELIGSDPATDLAIIKIERDGLPAARLGTSSDVRVGQWVIAVGNPFELLSSVTAGIVSAVGRGTVGLAEYGDFIQTDASINPGNSGGALANLDGEVIGINTAISSPSGGNVGIGFAIPIDMARDIMDDLLEDGSVDRGFLSLIPQDIDETLAAALDLESTDGALVADVTADGPADRGGVRQGDVILRFAGDRVEDARDLRNKVARAEPGSEVEIEVLRDGRRRSLDVELGERPVAGRVATRATPEEESFERLGLQLQELDDSIRRQLRLDSEIEGVVIAGVEPGSAAARAGLRRGDLIEQVGREVVTSVRELRAALDEIEDGKVALVIRRGGARAYVGLDLEP